MFRTVASALLYLVGLSFAHAQTPRPPTPAECTPQPRQLTVAELEKARIQYASEWTTYPESTRVLIGVDVLGRALVVLDTNRDGSSDRMFMFTSTERLKGPWSLQLDSATVVSTLGTLRVQSRDNKFVALLALGGADLPKLSGGKGVRGFRRSLVSANGMEFVINEAEAALTSLSFKHIESWPAQFHEDLLRPQTSEHGACTSGRAQ
jgi:hypothetical protein